MSGDLDIIKMLIACGADASAKDVCIHVRIFIILLISKFLQVVSRCSS